MPKDQTDQLRTVTQRFFRLFGALAAESTPCGKPLSMAHAHALMLLRTGGELSQQELAGELGIDKSNVTRLCARMAEVDHVTQRTSEHDARSRRVSLTPRGSRLATEVDAASRARFDALLKAIPAPRRRDVVVAMELLVAAVQASSGPSAGKERA